MVYKKCMSIFKVGIQSVMHAVAQSRRLFATKLSVYTIIIALIVLVTLNIVSVRRIISNPLRLVQYNPSTACHRSQDDDALPPLDESNMAPNKKYLFFHETSCNGRLNSRQSCSIESAAKMNSDWTVNVLFSGPLSPTALKTANIATLISIPNIKFQRIHIDKYAKGTPLESFFSRNLLRKSKFPVEHTSDVIRLLSLYKYGGLYIDMDMVVVRSLNSLPKYFMSKESNLYLGSAVLAWIREGIGRNISEMTLKELQTDYNPDKWAYNGPALLQRVLTKICSTSNVALMNNKTCKGFHILDAKYFYPITYNSLGKYFSKTETKTLQLGEEYTHHIWNAMSFKHNVTKDSFYQKLAQKFCPNIYKLYGDRFGT